MIEFTVCCADLDAAIDFYTGELGFRLDMIMPADAPRLALLSGHGVAVRLDVGEPRAHAPGRAGMVYRDLIPGRLGGRFIASHIRIPDGGPVPDYVHYHRVRFQAIYCRRGWVRVVYEDQGAPFVMHEGDCVLQPPEIRHRVLDASPGLEVIEIGAPAEHETWRDHELELPSAQVRAKRVFSDQRFVRHVAKGAVWQRDGAGGFEFSDTGIARATGGAASVRVLRALSLAPKVQSGEFLFLYVLAGSLILRGAALGTHAVGVDEAYVVPTGAHYTIEATADCEVLEVTLPTPSKERA
ncbi:MAG: cupin domain-containing protein [Micropepsaceae bacterium]